MRGDNGCIATLLLHLGLVLLFQGRPRGLEVGFADLHLVEENVAGFLRNPSQRGVTHRARLLVDFLEHEMLEAALFRLDGIPGNVLYRANDGLAVEIGEFDTVRGDDRHITVSEKENVAGVMKNCRHV